MPAVKLIFRLEPEEIFIPQAACRTKFFIFGQTLNKL